MARTYNEAEYLALDVYAAIAIWPLRYSTGRE
jgi:hypothetical protein